MTRDVDVLRLWLTVVFCIAAIAATLVPVLYSAYPWRQYRMGRLFMYKAIAFALTFDVIVLFQFWKPDILIVFWVETIMFTGIAFTALRIVWLMWNIIRMRARSKNNVVQ